MIATKSSQIIKTEANRVQELKLSDSVLDSVPDAIVIIREDGTIGYVNRQTEVWFGYERSAVLGKELETLIPERFRGAHRHMRAKYNENPTPRPMGSGLELFGRRKDGTEFPVDITIGPLKVDNQHFYIAIVRDVTERKKLELERDRAIGAREELVALITHDLKNPLTAIALSSELLEAWIVANGADPKSSLIINSIKTATDRMFLLIKSILIQKKMEFGGFVVEKAAGNVATLVDEVFSIMEPIAARKSLALEKRDLPPGLKLICDFDRARVKQVFENLIDNAIKFTPAGGTITIQSQEEHDFIRFSITDTGPGMTEDTVSHLFTAYYQPKETSHQGTGLGLSICKGIVEAHGGKIWVVSVPGQGASFRFTLPVHKKIRALVAA